MASLQGGDGGSVSSSLYRGGAPRGTPGGGTYVKSTSSSRKAAPKKTAPRQTYTPPATPIRSYTPPASAIQRYSSGKSVGSSSTGRISSVAPPPAAPPPPPKPPSIDEWLAGDTAYKQQRDASSKAYKDYIAQMTGQRGSYETEYNRNLMNTADAEKLATSDLENDYASRGLTNSGLFVKARTDLATDYDKRESALGDGRAEFLSNLAAALTNFKGTQGINDARYKNEAIARRAAKYDV